MKHTKEEGAGFDGGAEQVQDITYGRMHAPQLSLHAGEKTLRKLETAARLENVSVSKYVVRKLNETMRSSWPERYEQLYGAVQDESFRIDRPADFSVDTERRQL